jgi:glycerol uptake facilitator-like aquaporin
MKGFIGSLLFIALIALYYSSGGQANNPARDFAIAAIIATIIAFGTF